MSDLTLDLDLLQDALEANAAFIAWCGVGATVADHVFQVCGDNTHFPQVVISHGPQWRQEIADLDTGFLTTPQMLVEFVNVCEKSDTNGEVFRALAANVGMVMDELKHQTLWRFAAWYPGSENTPARASASASTDYASYRIYADGIIRDEVET